MEDLNLIDDMEMEGGLNAQMKDYIMETAKWAKFIAIVMIVLSSLIAIGVILGGSFISKMMSMQGVPGIGAGFVISIYLLMAALMFIPNLFLLNFANNAKRALTTGNENTLIEAFEKLKSYFKFNGILMAIVVGFYALIFVFGIFGGLMSM